MTLFGSKLQNALEFGLGGAGVLRILRRFRAGNPEGDIGGAQVEVRSRIVGAQAGGSLEIPDRILILGAAEGLHALVDPSLCGLGVLRGEQGGERGGGV